MASLKDSISNAYGNVSENVNKSLNADLLSGAVENFAKEGLTAAFNHQKLDKSFLENLTAQAAGNLDLGALFGGEGRNSGYMRNYATDFIPYAPKPKFLFKIEIEFHEGLKHYFSNSLKFQYLIKAIDRPKITYEYDEINMYNFRSKVLRKMSYDPLSMTFYDDIKNKVVDFVNMYRMMMSPGARVGDPTTTVIQSTKVLEDSGLNTGVRNISSAGAQLGFSSASTGSFDDWSSTDTIPTGIIKYIRLHQVYAHGSRVTSYTFYNPKIENIELDSLDYESSDASMINMTFGYDLLDITDQITFKTPGSVFGYDMVGNSDSILARRAYKNSGDSDSFDQGNGTQASKPTGIGDIISTGIKNAIPSVLSQQTEKAIQKLVGKSGIGSVKVKNAIAGNVGSSGGNFVRKGIEELLGVKK